MAEVSQTTIDRARTALNKVLDDEGLPVWSEKFLGALEADELLDITTDQLDLAIDDADVASAVLIEQIAEIDQLRDQVRQYASAVGELRITNALLSAKLAVAQEMQS